MPTQCTIERQLISTLNCPAKLYIFGIDPPISGVAPYSQSIVLGNIQPTIQQLLKWILLADRHDAKFGLHSEGLLLVTEVRVSMPIIS